MKKDEIKSLLDEAVKDDQDLNGLLVYNLTTGEVVASTFPDDYSKKTIEISRIFQGTEKEAVSIVDSAGGTNWVMKSLARKVIYDVKISGDVWLFGETKISEAPTAALEDGLELALMIGRLI